MVARGPFDFFDFQRRNRGECNFKDVTIEYAGNQNPNFQGNPLPRTVNEWFDPTAYSIPALGTWGNVGRGVLNGPSLADFDFSLFKTAPIKEANYFMAHRYLGLAYVQKSMHKEAVAEFEKSLAISSDNTMALWGLGYTYAVAGRKAEAQKVLDRLNELSKQKCVPAASIAALYAGLGEKHKAIEWLEKGFDDRSIYHVKVYPIFDPLRSDPCFTDLLRRMNLH
jgi:tetratricopeptide (TPR) repeat protein